MNDKAQAFANVAPNQAVFGATPNGVYAGGAPISMGSTEATGVVGFWTLEGTKTSIASGQAGPHAIVADETHVYWLNAGVDSNNLSARHPQGAPSEQTHEVGKVDEGNGTGKGGEALTKARDLAIENACKKQAVDDVAFNQQGEQSESDSEEDFE